MHERPFIHPTSLVASKKIGHGTRIWAFVNIGDEVEIGENCNICDHVFIESGVIIGNNVTLKCGVFLWKGMMIEDDVFVGPNATFCNDKYPKSGKRLDSPLSTILKVGCSIGANATILPNIVIGEHATVGAGSVVTRDVPAYSTFAGNPARKLD